MHDDACAPTRRRPGRDPPEHRTQHPLASDPHRRGGRDLRGGLRAAGDACHGGARQRRERADRPDRGGRPHRRGARRAAGRGRAPRRRGREHRGGARQVTRQVDELTAAAEAALESERVAQRAQATAESERATQELRLRAATALVDSRKGELGRWASQTYRHGGSMGEIEGFMTLLESESSDDLGQRVQMLDLVGRWRGSVVDTVEEAEAVQEDATEKSAAAAEAAEVAAAQAVQARSEADAALQAQQAQVAVFGALLRKVSTEAEAADDKTEEMARVRAEAEQLGSRPWRAPGRTTASPGPSATARVSRPSLPQRPDPRRGPVPGLCLPRPPAAGRRRVRVQHAEPGLRRGVRHPDLHHRLLPDAAGADRGARGQADPGRRAGHEQPRLGHRRRPVRRDPDLRLRPARVDAAERAPARLVPPVLGAADRQQARGVALGVRRLTLPVALRRTSRRTYSAR